MPEAYIVRDIERQRLFENLKSQAYKYEEEMRPKLLANWPQHKGVSFFTELAEAMTSCLDSFSSKTMDYAKELAPLPRPAGLVFHLCAVLPTITDFSRSLAERNVLIVRFLESYVLPEISNTLNSELQREEFMHPEIIFHAKGAMEEVPLPNEED